MSKMLKKEKNNNYQVPTTILKSFAILRWIGAMPMMFRVDQDHGLIIFRSSKTMLLWSVVANMIYIAVPLAICIALVIGSNIRHEPFSDFAKLNYLNTDIAAQCALFIANILAFFKFLATLYNMAEGLNKFSSSLSKLSFLVDIHERTNSSKKGMLRIFKICLLFIPVAIGYSTSIYFFLDNSDHQASVFSKASIAITFAITFLISLFPLVPLTGVLFITHSLQLCSLCIQKYWKETVEIKIKSAFEEEEKNEDKRKEDERENVVVDFSRWAKNVQTTGHKIVDFLMTTEDSIGLLVFDELMFSFIFATLGLYLGSTMLFMSNEGKENSRVLASGILLSASNAWIGVIYLFRIYFVVAYGQCIENHVMLTLSDIQTTMRKHFKKLTEEDIFQLCLLMDRFKETKAIRPRKSFNLNKGMLISALGTAATYLFVLLQFKTGENSEQNEH